jgi:hypothetical protein
LVVTARSEAPGDRATEVEAQEILFYQSIMSPPLEKIQSNEPQKFGQILDNKRGGCVGVMFNPGPEDGVARAIATACSWNGIPFS